MNTRLSFLRRSLAVGIALVIPGATALVNAQEPVQESRARQAATQIFSPDQLDNLVAPIALYSDPLLSQVLVACTYPLEIVEAQQWLQRNNSLNGATLMTAAQQRNWDPSVQALAAFPDVLAKLNQDIRWTTDLGNAFLAQQADVMSAVQRMRASAKGNGKLSSTPQQIVTTQAENGQSAVEIQPADQQVIYVPTYDPMYVWGPPVWGAYPPLFYPDFGFGFGPGADVGLCFGDWGGWGTWGWGPNWFGHGVIVNATFFRHYGFGPGWGSQRTGWIHDPAHRLGVPYPSRQLAGQFQAASRWNAGRTGTRDAFGKPYGASRSALPGPQTGGRQYGSRSETRGDQRSERTAPQASMRNFQTPPRLQSRPSFQIAPRSISPGFGGGMRSFGGGAGPSTRGGGSFGGGGARGFGGGGRTFSGGAGGGGGRRR